MQHSTFNDGRSYLLVPAPKDRVYWFFFHVMDGTYYGKDIPRFSKEDEKALASKYFDDNISDSITFRDIYEGRQVATLVALEEHVFSRWNYRRILLIGDSAHKVRISCCVFLGRHESLICGPYSFTRSQPKAATVPLRQLQLSSTRWFQH